MVDAFNMTVMQPYPITATSALIRAVGGANLATPQPGERATFGPSDGAQWYDVGSAVTVNQLALLYTDLQAGETVNFYATNNADYSGQVYLGTVQPDASALAAPAGYRHMYLNRLASPATFRYWLVSVYCANGATRSAGVFAIGGALQVEYNPDYGSTSWGYEEAPDPDTLDSGVTVLEELAPAPYFEFSITWASEDEMEAAWNQTYGPLQWLRRPVLVVRRPDAYSYRHSGIFWGILRLQPFVASQFNMHEVSGKIRSMV